ncbi:unnamed protein product, partial [Prorocentrum cordatum]
LVLPPPRPPKSRAPKVTPAQGSLLACRRCVEGAAAGGAAARRFRAGGAAARRPLLTSEPKKRHEHGLPEVRGDFLGAAPHTAHPEAGAPKHAAAAAPKGKGATAAVRQEAGAGLAFARGGAGARAAGPAPRAAGASRGEDLLGQRHGGYVAFGSG